MIKKKKNFCEKTKIQKFKTSKMKLKYNLICILITKINKMYIFNKIKIFFYLRIFIFF